MFGGKPLGIDKIPKIIIIISLLFYNKPLKKGFKMIIDLHAHTSNHELWNLHTRLANLDTLRALAQKFGIGKIFLMATYFPLKKSGLHNLELLERIKGDKLFDCFGSLNLENTDLCPALDELRLLAENNQIAGIKLYPGYQNIVLSDPKFDPVYNLAQEFKLPVAVHLGELQYCCLKDKREKGELRCGRTQCLLDKRTELSRPQQLSDAAWNFPGVNFIACHLGNPYFSELHAAMNFCPNIYSDISGQFVSGTAEDTPAYRARIIEEIQLFLKLPGGMERVLFGTDFPIQSYQDTFDIVKALNLSTDREKMLLGGNALKLMPRKGQS